MRLCGEKEKKRRAGFLSFLSNKKTPLSIVLVSGGLDSAVTAAIAAEKGETAFLHANYGQRTEQKELRAFHKIAGHYKVEKKLVVNLGYLAQIGGSALTEHSIEVPPGDLENLDVPATYVPFRNAHLLSVAVSWAEVIGAGSIYIGVVEEDSSGYPDCRESFIKSFEKTVSLGTRPETVVKIETPLLKSKKSELIKTGADLGAPFELTWSCYSTELYACGECDSCLLRLKGFKEAGLKDPIKYRAAP